MTEERTAGGLVGKVAGRLKSAAGSLTDNDDLAREGRLQEAQSDAGIEAREAQAEARLRDEEAQVKAEQAETEAERRELDNELAAKDR
jgi:uncharacterized protein YjbJ (UPF0337 family)